MNNRVFASVTAFALLIFASTSHAFFKVPDTDFGAPKGLEMVGYETKSLLMKFNYKTRPRHWPLQRHLEKPQV